MDEKTAELRDLFLDVADEETVTESQAESRGTLAGSDADVEDRLEDVISRMRDRFEFETDLADETYVAVVRQFYDGRSDAEIGEDLDRAVDSVVRARLDLHLVREEDATGVDLDALREQLADGADVTEAAATLDVEEDLARRAERVLSAHDASRRVSHRFRSEFEEILTDADLAVRLTAGAQEDGLEDATEDAEVDLDL